MTVSKTVTVVKAEVLVCLLQDKQLEERTIFVKPIRGKIYNSLAEYENANNVKIVRIYNQEETTKTYTMPLEKFISLAEVKEKK